MGDLIQPNIETITSVDGGVYERITYPDGHIEMRVIRPPFSPPFNWHYDSSILSQEDAVYHYTGNRRWNYDLDSVYTYSNIKSKEEEDVDIIRKNSYNSDEHIVACCNEKDLSTDSVLKTLSAVKGRLMLDIAPIHVKTIECSITPQVRQNIITASKRLKMYGKKRPIVARFDEYGNRLPDEIDIGNSHGITLKIIDPEKYGKYYFELKAIEHSAPEYKITFDDTFVSEDDLPF